MTEKLTRFKTKWGEAISDDNYDQGFNDEWFYLVVDVRW